MSTDMMPCLQTTDRPVTWVMGEKMMKKAGVDLIKFSCTATVGVTVKRKAFKGYFKGKVFYKGIAVVQCQGTQNSHSWGLIWLTPR